jgi:fibronectin type 3 domain-containing protein
MIQLLKISILTFLLIGTQTANAQTKKTNPNPVFTIKAVGNKVITQFNFPKTAIEEKGTMNIILYRGNENNEGIKAIHQLNNISVSSYYYHIDSTLPGQGTYQYTIEVMSNDAVVLRESKMVYAYAAGVSPAIKTFDAKAKMQSNQVTLKWELTNTFLASNITILRSRKRETGYIAIATLKNTDKTYLDIVDDANEPFFYQLQVVDLSKSESIYTPTIFVVADFVIKPEKAKNVRGAVRRNKPTIYWESTDAASRGFYIYKKNTADNKFLQASGIIIKDSADKFFWTDSSSLLKAGQTYEYYIFSESNSYTKSEPSDTVRLTIEAEQASVIVPAPQDIRIIQNGDAPINIVWEANSDNEDITGYAVYQKKLNEREYRLLPNGSAGSEINYITISNPETGSSFIVKAKSGDKESAASRAVQWNNKEDKTFGPKHLKGEIIDNELTLSWLANDNADIKEYKLYKWTSRDYTAAQTIDKNTNSVVVKNYIAGEKNQYMLTAINIKGVESEGTKAITVY